jgi:hypothetical protein
MKKETIRELCDRLDEEAEDPTWDTQYDENGDIDNR